MSAAWDPPRRSTSVEQPSWAETLLAFNPNSPKWKDGCAEKDFAGIAGLQASYWEDGELLVINRGKNNLGFAVCLKCGYADSESSRGSGMMDLPRDFEQHAPLTQTKNYPNCLKPGKDVSPWRNKILAAKETTDVLHLDFSRCKNVNSMDANLIVTLGLALKLAGTRMLELDSRELGMLLVPSGEAGAAHGIAVYDAVPGGAGYVRELFDRGQEWLEVAQRDVLYINEEHHRHCSSACMDCLLSFEAQYLMNDYSLVRPQALVALRAMIGEL